MNRLAKVLEKEGAAGKGDPEEGVVGREIVSGNHDGDSESAGADETERCSTPRCTT